MNFYTGFLLAFGDTATIIFEPRYTWLWRYRLNNLETRFTWIWRYRLNNLKTRFTWLWRYRFQHFGYRLYLFFGKQNTFVHILWIFGRMQSEPAIDTQNI